METERSSHVVIPTESDIERARIRGRTLVAAYAKSVCYDRGALTLVLRSGLTVKVPAKLISELNAASPSQLRAIQLSRDGGSLELRDLDIDISVPGLLRDLLAFDAQSRGGKARTAAKIAAARTNGRRGGRPKKLALLKT